MADDQNQGTFETRKDAGEGPKGAWSLWDTALKMADKEEEDWRKKARNAETRFRDEKERKRGKFGILYSNMETMAPVVYNSTPRPDVRRRFDDEDPVAKVASDAFERSLSHCIDEYDFDDVMASVTHDALLKGRGQAIVLYEPTMQGDEVTYETTRVEHVPWDDFRRGPGKKWNNVPWCAVRFRITRDEAVKLNPKIGGTVTLDHTERTSDEGMDTPDIFKRLTVWKIWDKTKRQIVYHAPSYKDGPFQTEGDTLGLQGFFPFPRPIYDIRDPSSLIPLVPYEQYRDQAEELDIISARIKSLVKVLRWRGIRSSQIEELDRLKDADDGELIPSESAAATALGGGDLSKAIWLMPIEQLIQVVRELILQREAVKQVIFEISGISDILRGDTDPSETLGAQRIKAQFGSARMQARQRDGQRFSRDLMRIKAEIIGEQYSIETLQMVTSIQLPTPEEKAAAQQQIEVLQTQQLPEGQQPPQIPPEVQEMLRAPTWVDVKKVMASDTLRSFRVDIETDSTIEADLGQAQQNMSAFIEGFGSFVQAMAPAVQAEVMPLDVVTDILTGFARNFKLGRQAEDALEKLGKQAPAPKGPSPEQLKLQADAKAKEQDMAMKAEESKAKLQLESERLRLDRTKAEVEANQRAEDLALRREEGQQKMAFEQRKFDGTEEGRFAKDVENLRSGSVQASEGIQQALAVAAEALNQIAALRQDLSAPKTIDVERQNGRVVGGTVSQGSIQSEIVLN